MLTLLEAAKLVQDPLKRGVIEIFPRVSPVLERLPFFEVAGQAYKYNIEETLPGIAFRGINETYTSSTGCVNPQVEAMYILGGLSKVDRALVKTQGNINNLRATYDSMKAKSVALEYTKKFFKGDNESNANEFDGLEKRLTGNQVVDLGSSDGGDTLTLAKLDEMMDQVQGSPDVLFMNKTMRRKVNALMRSSSSTIEMMSDSLGRQIPSYAGVPIAVVEQDKDGADILAFDEPDLDDGDQEVCTSIYAVRFGLAEYVSGLQSGSIDVIDQGLQGTFYQTLVEFICGLGCFHPKCAARLRGIKNA